MRYATDIRLEELIVHIVNPRKSDGFVLSQRTVPLDGNDQLKQYFVDHIRNSLTDPATKAASFINLDEKSISDICKCLIEGNLGMVEGSKRLAQHLHAILSKDKRISPGDLAICSYQAGNHPTIPRYLALLKIDPSDVFRHKTECDSEGNQYVSFEVETDVMPTTGEKLQKCAFIQPLSPQRPEYDMMLLDRQVRQGTQFFADKFLGAKLALDAQSRTERLYIALTSSNNQLRPHLTPGEDLKFQQAINTVINAKSVNIDEFLKTLPLKEDDKNKINENVSQRLPDREFEIDSSYAQKLTRKRRFRGDHDLRIDVSAEFSNDVIQNVERMPGTDGKPPYYRVVIHSERWEEIPR